MHDRKKIDAPSGTARRLGAMPRRAAAPISRKPRCAAATASPARGRAGIGYAALRGGTVVGDMR